MINSGLNQEMFLQRFIDWLKSGTILNSKRLTLLLGKFLSFRLFEFSYSGSRFTTKKTTSPVTPDLIMTIIEVRFDRFHDLCEVSSVTRVNLQNKL